ncbi:unnamed protein product [Larinioides sclopetarius]|uniref:Uncharacterized protein n=1 Tax=Larinioides sclopetarius TaxID=280406 RepID=A0AAV2BS24_9ARAC
MPNNIVWYSEYQTTLCRYRAMLYSIQNTKQHREDIAQCCMVFRIPNNIVKISRNVVWYSEYQTTS